jgi:hypothetical protein
VKVINKFHHAFGVFFMSRASSLTPDEKNAGIKKAASLSDEVVRGDVEFITLMQQPMQSYIEIQQRVEQDQAQLDTDPMTLALHNNNPVLVEDVKSQIRNAAQDFLARNKAHAAEKSLKKRFDELVRAYPDNLVLQEIDRNRNYHHMHNLGQGVPRESKSNNRIGGYTGALRDSMLQVLVELKENELLTPARMRAAQAYYQQIIMHYLRKKIYEAYKKATRLDTKHQVLEGILKKLQSVLFKLYDKTAGYSEFAKELKEIVSTEYSMPLKDKKDKEYHVTMNLLTGDTSAKLMLMEDLLSDQYIHYSTFEKRMAEFRDKYYSRWQSSLLYNLLPDTMAKAVKPKSDSLDAMLPDIEPDYFPYLKDKDEHTSSRDAYKEYQRQLRQVQFTSANNAELELHRSTLATNIDTAIQNNFTDGAMRLLVINFTNVLKVEHDVLSIIVAVMVKVLDSNKYPEPEFADPQFEAIFEGTTVLDVVQKLEKYAADKDENHQELRNNLLLLSASLQVPDVLANVMLDSAQIEKFKTQLTQYHLLQAEYDKAERSKFLLQAQVNSLIDRPLIDLLRAQVLHAAKLYFNPAEKTGLMHKRHHPFSERAAVLDLIYQLFSPNLTTFAVAVGYIRRFMSQQKGLHTNSLDTLLSYVLYNEGTPRGLFNLKLSDVMAFNVSRAYPGYTPDDVHYRKGEADITKDDIKAIKTYLNANYTVPEASMVGRVGSMVRGQQRLQIEAELHIVRQQLVTNLASRATMIEQFKAGQEVEFKAESIQAPVHAARR